MAGSFSDFLEKKVNNLLLGQGAFTPSAVLYLGLFTDSNNATQRDAGTVTEWPAAYVSYARAPVSANGVFFSASGTTAYVSNLSALSFGSANCSGPVTVSGFGFFDANSAGNLYHWADLTVPKTINSGDVPTFAIGAIGITLD